MDINARPTAIFDFDGTIADSFFLIAEGYKEFAPKLGIKSTEKFNLEELRDLSAREIINKYRISLWKIGRVTPQIWKFMAAKLESVEPIPGISALLKKLEEMEVRMLILTSNSERNVKDFLEKNKLEYFEAIYSKRQLLGKAAGIKKVIKLNSLDMKRTLYIGDEARDIEAAKKAGIPIIAVTWGFNSKLSLKRAGPDFLVEKPEEIIDILKNY